MLLSSSSCETAILLVAITARRILDRAILFIMAFCLIFNDKHSIAIY